MGAPCCMEAAGGPIAVGGALPGLSNQGLEGAESESVGRDAARTSYSTATTAMDSYSDLEAILSDVAQDVQSTSQGGAVQQAFSAYRECLEPLVTPYVRDGFLDEQPGLARFLSETATLHLTVSLIPHWCAAHGLGRAEGFWDIHPEARFFSWYRLPKALSSKIRSWAVAHSNIQDVVQAVTLVAEDSLAGLRRRALGEFFTPTEIARHLVSLADYDPLTIPTHTVVDPACGSGNLLAVVASEIVEAVRSGSLDPALGISNMNRNIHGFDIQPVAVLLTRLQLLLASLPVLGRSGLSDTNIYESLSFPCVELRDPLADPEAFWDLLARFDVVVANPPFLKVPKGRLPFVRHYEDVLAGQPNLYQLFLWWAIRATPPGGSVSFLVPQSIRAGRYLNTLRQAISDTCELAAVTCFADGRSIFDSVDQQMMLVALRKPIKTPQKPDVTIRVSADTESLKHLSGLPVGHDQVVLMQGDGVIWCVSNELTDYGIMTKLHSGETVLGAVDEFRVLNGGFVWNQHKERLTPIQDDNTLPLLSSASIAVHQFTFPPSDQRVSQRLFVDAAPPVPGPIHTSKTILLKRTIPKKLGGRRIVAAMLPDDFLVEYPAYFAENHVNLICATQDDVSGHYMIGLCAWLNSRLANFVFGMMNGSSHLSKFELGLIPTPVALIAELAHVASALPHSPIEDQRQLLDEIDRCVSDFFGLAARESQRLARVVPPAV